MQLDNDLILTPYPVVLSSKPVPDKPVFQVALVRDMRYTHFYCFRYFAFSLQEIDVMVDQAFLLSILSWVAVVLDYMSSVRENTFLTSRTQSNNFSTAIGIKSRETVA